MGKEGVWVKTILCAFKLLDIEESLRERLSLFFSLRTNTVKSNLNLLVE